MLHQIVEMQTSFKTQDCLINWYPGISYLSNGTPKTLSQTLLCATGKVRKDIVSTAISPMTRAYLRKRGRSAS